MKNSWKRVASGALALAIVASNVTANVGTGGLFDSTAITASAATSETKTFVANNYAIYSGSTSQSPISISWGAQAVVSDIRYFSIGYSSSDTMQIRAATGYEIKKITLHLHFADLRKINVLS